MTISNRKILRLNFSFPVQKLTNPHEMSLIQTSILYHKLQMLLQSLKRKSVKSWISEFSNPDLEESDFAKDPEPKSGFRLLKAMHLVQMQKGHCM